MTCIWQVGIILTGPSFYFSGFLILGIFLATLSPLALLVVQHRPSVSPVWYYATHALNGLVNWMAVSRKSSNAQVVVVVVALCTYCFPIVAYPMSAI
jgi:hypothetical protein